MASPASRKAPPCPPPLPLRQEKPKKNSVQLGNVKREKPKWVNQVAPDQSWAPGKSPSAHPKRNQIGQRKSGPSAADESTGKRRRIEEEEEEKEEEEEEEESERAAKTTTDPNGRSGLGGRTKQKKTKWNHERKPRKKKRTKKNRKWPPRGPFLARPIKRQGPSARVFRSPDGVAVAAAY